MLAESSDGYISCTINGDQVEQIFENEPGGHRHQRPAPTDKRGRVHTSTVTVSVLKPGETKSQVKISDIEYRFANIGSKGGQHSNKTQSGVIATHIPTGISVTSNGRDQHSNKAYATEVLKAKVAQHYQTSNNKLLNNERRSQIGSGQRGDKVRTYRWQDNVTTCHITGKKKSLSSVLKGDICF